MSVESICKNVLKLTDDELAKTRAMAEEQLHYLHPLKLATQARQHALGAHNLRVLDALENLRTVLRAPPD